MTTGAHGPQLIGREHETRRLDDLIRGIRGGGGAMVVRGEAGIGKSALLVEAGRFAVRDGMRILATTGVQSEAQVAFAGLLQLLRPVLGEVDRLPGPQRGAVRAAFGQEDAVVPDLFLIALATLNLLGMAAVHTPVLLTVEDAQWLDRASVDVLAFVARRLDFEPIVLLAAIRDGFTSSFDDAGLTEMNLRPLDRAAAAALLDAAAPGLQFSIRERVLDEAAGNPLGLVELSVAVEHIGDSAGMAVWLPLTRRLEQAFASRASGLPTATRTLLLIAALNDGDALAETLHAGTIVTGRTMTVSDLVPAIDVRLVDVTEDGLRFRHPLMRSAIHQRSTVTERQLAHAALARILDTDAERRVWHRASATAGPDEDIAAELEEVAVRAHRRGGIEAAATALARAAQLSVDPARRGTRLVRAADLASELGRREVVLDLLRQAEPLDLSMKQRAQMAWVRDVFDDGIRDVAAGTRLLAELAERVAAEGDTDLALKLLSGAATRCYFAEPGDEVRHRVITAAERVCPDEHDPRLLAILGFVSPIERGAAIVRQLPRARRGLGDDPTSARLLGNAALSVGAFDVGLSMHTLAVVGLRAQGRLAFLARSVSAQSWCSLNLVDLSVAIPSSEEGIRLARETSQPNIRVLSRAQQAVIAALRGDHDGTERIAAEAERDSLPVGVRPALAVVQYARGLSALGDGRHTDAYEHLRRVCDPADPAYHVSRRCFLVGDVVEAAVRSGQPEAVNDLMVEMEAVASRMPSPSLHTGLRYARALLADDVSAEALFEVALRADLARWPFARARAQLAYGEWLRRHRRAADSRGHLRAARETFDALGTVPWSDRARLELRAAGETSRRRVPEARDLLTSHELQIALMAADGLTNREIGQKLYLSHRTVSTHLHRIFPKVGVTSRSALRAALRSTG